MATYRFIELAEHVLRAVPTSENNVVLIGTTKDNTAEIYLQRGWYPGDIWWSTPDGESVFNRFRIAYEKPKPIDLDGKPLKTPESIGCLFQSFARFIVSAGNYICVYEWTESKDRDAFPENNDDENMLAEVQVTDEEVKRVDEIEDSAIPALFRT